MRIFTAADELIAAVGEELGKSDWLTVTQDRIDQFAEATGDHQWIHVDVERANAESPYGKPIAHGYLTLSLLPMLGWQIYTVQGTKAGINYGSNKVRFLSPVLVDSDVRLVSVLREAVELDGGALQLVIGQTVEIKDSPKPALVAETISRITF